MTEEGVPPDDTCASPSDLSAAVDILAELCDTYASARSQLDRQIRARFSSTLDTQRTRRVAELQECLLQGSPEVRLWRSPRLIGCGSVSVAPAEVAPGVPYWSEEGLVAIPNELTPRVPPERTRVRLWRMELPEGSSLRKPGADIGMQARVSALGDRVGSTDVRIWMGAEASQESSVAFTGEWQWLSGSFPGLTVEVADTSVIDASGEGARLGVALTHVRPGHAWKGWLTLLASDDTSIAPSGSELLSGDSATRPVISAGRVELSVESEAYFLESGDGVAIRRIFCEFDADGTGKLSRSEFDAFAEAVESTIRFDDLLEMTHCATGEWMSCITLSQFAQLLYLDPRSCHFGRQTDDWALVDRKTTSAGRFRDSKLPIPSVSNVAARDETRHSANDAWVEYMFEDAGTNIKIHRAAARKNPWR